MWARSTSTEPTERPDSPNPKNLRILNSPWQSGTFTVWACREGVSKNVKFYCGTSLSPHQLPYTCSYTTFVSLTGPIFSYSMQSFQTIRLVSDNFDSGHTDMEFVKCFTRVRFYFEQIVSIFENSYSNTKSIQLFCEKSSLNWANFRERVIFCVNS